MVIQRCFASQLNVTIDTRIVGGYVEDIKNIPYQVSIQWGNSHFCGGSLITPNTVLSAAHCFGKSYSASSLSLYSVKYGSNTTNSSLKANIESVIVHPSYNTTTLDYDLSLIILKSSVNLSDTVKTINISESNNYVWGSLAAVSGWGYEQENATTISPLLRKVVVPLVSPQNCSTYYKDAINITNHMICAGYPEGLKDSCQGDSGGPLVLNGTLIGVVSFGMGCGRPSYPGVYTNVASLAKWVADNSNYTINAAFSITNTNTTLFAIILTLILVKSY